MYEIGTDPLPPDLAGVGLDPNDDDDGDFLLSGEEINEYGADPRNSDSEGDGVNDYLEIVTYGSDPWEEDTTLTTTATPTQRKWTLAAIRPCRTSTGVTGRRFWSARREPDLHLDNARRRRPQPGGLNLTASPGPEQASRRAGGAATRGVIPGSRPFCPAGGPVDRADCGGHRSRTISPHFRDRGDGRARQMGGKVISVRTGPGVAGGGDGARALRSPPPRAGVESSDDLSVLW